LSGDHLNSKAEYQAAGSLADAVPEHAVDATPPLPDAERLNGTAREAAAASPLHEAMSSPGQDDTRSPEPLPQTLPEIQANACAGGNANDVEVLALLPVPSPLDGEKENNSPSDSTLSDDASVAAHPTLNESFAALHALSEEELIALFS
jgi:hypothetical protein